MDNKTFIFKRAYIVYGLIFILAVTIIGKVLYVQLAQGDMWRAKAIKQSLRYFNIEPNRGNIYDSDGEVLATSVPLFELRMDVASPDIPDSSFNKDVDSLSLCLANIFKDKNKKQYKLMLLKARVDKNRYLLLKRNVDYEQLKSVRTFPLFRSKKHRGGLITTIQYKRIYPYDNLAYRTIGWYKEESPNNVGIEASFNKQLEGEAGKKLYQRIPGDYWRPIANKSEVQPKNGNDIITTLDINLQDVAESALYRQLVKYKAYHGSAIVMDVKTGEIKAIANLGKVGDSTYSENYNYAIAESAEPGSTFKLYSLLAAFEDNKVKLNDRYSTTVSTVYANRVMTDGTHGRTGTFTVQELFEHSSNVGISKIITKAYGAKPQKFIDRLYAFGINKKLGLEISGEGAPIVKNTSSKTWSKVSLPWMSIGYEVALTPLQTLTFYNAVANNGVMVKPYFIKEIRSNGLVVKSFAPTVLNARIASPQAIKMAQTMLEGVVENGTGKALRNPIYKFAGKTGTAQLAQNNSGYNKKNYRASFVGYFPADNPKYSCIVVVNTPNDVGIYGAEVSAPVVREIADRVYATDPDFGAEWKGDLAVKPENPFKTGFIKDVNYINKWMGYMPMQKHENGWMCSDGNISKGIPAQNKVMPNLIGMGIKDALYLLEKSGVKVQVRGVGMVKKQSLNPGSAIGKGQSVILELGV